MAYKNSVAATKETVTEGIAALSLLESFGLDIHPERCVRLRNRHASCKRCAEACTSGAISIEDGAWRFHPELCVKCGTCATVCPTCALEAQQPNDADLTRAALDSAAACEGTVVFACHEALVGAAEVNLHRVAEVVCLSRIEETLLFELLAKGAKRFVGVHGDCDRCPRRQGCVSVNLVAETAHKVADAWGIVLDYDRTTVFPDAVFISDEEADLARFLTKGSRQEVRSKEHSASGLAVNQSGQVEARLSPTHVQKDGTLPHFVPSRRLRLLDNLAKLGTPTEGELDTRLWGHILIDFSRCKSCKMCAVFCPTGAICKYSEGESIVGIEHYAAECVHCGLCQDICPAQAITSSTKVPVSYLSQGTTERYHMPDPDWYAGPTQILQRMKAQIGGNSVEHSY